MHVGEARMTLRVSGGGSGWVGAGDRQQLASKDCKHHSACFKCGSKAAVVGRTFLLSHLLQDLQVFHGLTASTASRKR